MPPRYWTGFDVVVNVVGYVPFGMLMVLALYPRVRGIWAVLLARCSACGVGSDGSGADLSAQPRAVEPRLVHQCRRLPDRRLSARWGVRSCLEREPPVPVRQRWFAPHASQGLVLLALWPLAQIYPQSYLFGHGQVLAMAKQKTLRINLRERPQGEQHQPLAGVGANQRLRSRYRRPWSSRCAR